MKCSQPCLPEASVKAATLHSVQNYGRGEDNSDNCAFLGSCPATLKSKLGQQFTNHVTPAMNRQCIQQHPLRKPIDCGLPRVGVSFEGTLCLATEPVTARFSGNSLALPSGAHS